MDINIIRDLRERFGGIRDQGKRPTCVAFAASDAHSFARGSDEPLSAEYAFFHAVGRTSHKDRMRGVPLKLISEAISVDGQPLEPGWPYLANLAATDAWEPPRDVEAVFYRNSRMLVAVMSSIYAALDEARPVILVMNISKSFYHMGLNSVVNAPSNEQRLNTHAVLAVGYGRINSGRCLLIRNSWGENWADRGYAWIHEHYIEPRLLDVGIMVETS